jgi:hypothetical protein
MMAIKNKNKKQKNHNKVRLEQGIDYGEGTE